LIGDELVDPGLHKPQWSRRRIRTCGRRNRGWRYLVEQ